MNILFQDFNCPFVASQVAPRIVTQAIPMESCRPRNKHAHNECLAHAGQAFEFQLLFVVVHRI